MSGYDVKFSNKYPLRGINKRPIMSTKEVKEMTVAYQQATKVGKVSSDAAVKNTAGEYVTFSTNMAEVLPTVAKELKEKEEEPTEDGPLYDMNTNIFLANGVPIVIKDAPEGVGALITWEGGEQLVESGTLVFGGGENKHYPSSSITIEGGDLNGSYTNVFGGGKDGNVDDAVINITGGKVYVVYGGGRLNSVVKNVAINVTGGEIGQLVGGGAASVTGPEGSVGDADNPKDSPCRTENVTMNITGGTIYAARDGYGLLSGGGQGYSYTGNVVMNIGGTVDLSNTCYVTGGGSNGMTESTKVTVEGSANIWLLQSGNRGHVGTAEMIINGGTIGSMYAGGEEDGSVTPIYDGADPAIKVAINGGTITTLKTGKEGNAVIAPDSPVIAATYKTTATITNLEEAKTLFGTSLVEEV